MSNNRKPAIDATINTTLTTKNFLGDQCARISEPVRQPIVRKIKYRLVANDAACISIPNRSIRIFGAVVFVPTSIPTWHMIPMNISKMNGLPNKAIHSAKVDGFPSGASSLICVAPSRKIAITATTI